MQLSIIIVNYNVKYFLEQCLCSVEKALRAAGLEMVAPPAPQGQDAAAPETGGAEIFVVDNHSSDGSAAWLPTCFPAVQFILNTDNKGFGAANNQALARAKGKYVLFLNPDTILPEDVFSVCLAFMGSHPAAGAVGLRMVDGSGHFLKESRRGFPSPWVAFCKLSGLTALFPHSAVFAKYYLGQLSPMQDHPAPILPGAFMFTRKEALDKTGGFDERFFLYAEDIDLSYRIEQAGYTNYYVSATTILHFKGESTQKDSRYVKLFYKAMSQFRRKHFRGIGSALFNVLVEGAVWARGAVAATANLFRGGDKMGSRGDDQSANPGIGNDPTGKDGSKGVPARPVWVCGDEPEAARLRALLSGRKRVLAFDPASAREIIFCEGPGLSFKEIIRSLEEGGARGSLIYKIHAAHSAAAVGSPSKNERGDSIVL